MELKCNILNLAHEEGEPLIEPLMMEMVEKSFFFFLPRDSLTGHSALLLSVPRSLKGARRAPNRSMPQKEMLA